MAFCETCGKEFKTEQGLAGHQQLKHARQRSAERWDEGSVSAGQHSAERSLSAQPTAGERLERIESALQELLSPAPQHAHESSCHECHHFAEEVHKQGRVDGIQECSEYYEAIPGVTEARERSIANREMVDSNIIKITRAEDQEMVDANIIKITGAPPIPIATPEGDLQRSVRLLIQMR